jgi:hypothetical protein
VYVRQAPAFYAPQQQFYAPQAPVFRAPAYCAPQAPPQAPCHPQQGRAFFPGY